MAAAPPDPELETLRGEVDRLDAAMVELLAERMAVVGRIARVKRADGAAPGPAIRPAREAVILRRLVERAAGRFPAGALVRMWRELLAATTRAQAPLAVVVHVPPDQPGLWDLARDHFGSLTPVTRAASSSQALRLLAEDPTRLAVLPLPDEGLAWWTSLLEGAPRHPARVVARLPFVRDAPGGRGGGALVVAALDPEPSGDDAALVAFLTRDGLSRARLLDLLAGAGLGARWLTAAAADGHGPCHLVELDGDVAPDAGRLARALDDARGHVLRAAWLGGYARPLPAGA